MVIQIWVSGRLCLANEWSKAETLLQEKLTVFAANDKIQAFKQELNFGKPISYTVNLTSSQYGLFK